MESMDRYLQTFIDSYTGYARYLYREITIPSWHNYFYWLIGISLFFFTFEWFFSWRKDQPKIRQDFWLDGFYMFFNFFLFSLIGYNAISSVFVQAFNELLASVGITNMVAIRIGSWPVWLQLLTLFVLRDFIQWNVHKYPLEESYDGWCAKENWLQTSGTKKGGESTSAIDLLVLRRA